MPKILKGWPDPQGDETEEAAMSAVTLNTREKGDIRIVLGFLNAYHGVFQRYLDEELKIDPAEAEIIIDYLRRMAGLDEDSTNGHD